MQNGRREVEIKMAKNEPKIKKKKNIKNKSINMCGQKRGQSQADVMLA